MDEFNPSDFFKAIRQSASVKAGAIMFGQAQIAYYDTLKEHMTEEQAYNMLAHTTEQVVRGLFSAVAPVSEVLLKMAALYEMLPKPPESDKKVPGE